MKKLLILMLVFLISLTYISYANEINIIETFGTNTFKYPVNISNLNYSYLDNNVKRNFDDSFYFIADDNTFRGSNITNQSTEMNTKEGLIFEIVGLGIATPVNIHFVYANDNNEDFSFSSNSYVNFYCKNFLNILGGTSSEGYLFFQTEDNKYYIMTLDYLNAGGDETCTEINGSLGGNVINCDGHMDNICNSAGLALFNFTYQNKTAYLPNLHYFKTFGIGFEIPSTAGYNFRYAGKIDDINVNFLNGSNLLPEFNVSINQTRICLPENEDNTLLNFSINVFDNENDTIYYATESGYQINYKKEISYTRKLCILSCSYVPDSRFLQNVYYDGDYCHIEPITFNATAWNLIGKVSVEPKFKYMLKLTDDCLHTLIYSYKLDVELEHLFYLSDIYDFNNDGNSFDLKFKDSSYDDVLVLQFNYTGTNLTVFNFNGTTYNLIYNYAENDHFYIDLVTFIDSITTKLYIHTSVNGINVTYLSDERIKYVNYENIKGSFFQDGFTYGGDVFQLNFTTIPINNIAVTGLGIQRIDIFVSDEFHQPEEYNQKSFFVELVDSTSEYCYSYVSIPIGTIEEQYTNPNGLIGIPLKIDQLLWLLKFPARFAKSFNLYEEVLIASIIIIVLSFGGWLFKFADLSKAVILTYLECIILFLLSLIYLDIFILFSFLFSYFISLQIISTSSTENIEIKRLFVSYIIFYIIMFLTGLSTITNLSLVVAKGLGGNSFFSLQGIGSFFLTFTEILLSFLFFIIIPVETNIISMTLFNILNFFIIGVKLIVFVELIEMIKRLLELIPFI